MSFLTSTVHKFPDVSGGHDLVGAQIIRNVATDGHDNGHDEVGECRNYAHLKREMINGKQCCYVTETLETDFVEL